MALPVVETPHNVRYLRTKRERTGHLIQTDDASPPGRARPRPFRLRTREAAAPGRRSGDEGRVAEAMNKARHLATVDSRMKELMMANVIETFAPSSSDGGRL